MRREVYPSVIENGEAGAQRKVGILQAQYPRAKIYYEKGYIPQWGSAIPTSSTYGKSEPGFRVIVEHPD